MLIIVDAGMAVAIFFLVIFFGMTSVEALEVWISENFIWIIVGLIIISIIKSIVFLKKNHVALLNRLFVHYVML